MIFEYNNSLKCFNFKPRILEGEKCAVYLYKNDNKIFSQWYSKELAYLPYFGVGEYFAKVFVKSRNGQISESYTSVVNVVDQAYDVSKWNGSFFLDERKLLELRVQDGMQKIIFSDSYVDFYLKNVARNENKQEVLFVCFGGAVSSRKGKSAPFFSGLSIAKNLDLPLVSVADSTLSMSRELSLSWYAGSKFNTLLPFKIAAFLDVISQSCGYKKIVMFGGSGGGFAALSILQLLKTPAVSAVWNPQTSISKYNVKAVHRYIEIAYSSIGKDNLNAFDFFERHKVRHDVTKILPAIKNGEVLYLQNSGDEHHVINHLKPLLNCLEVEEESEFVKKSKSRIWFFEKNWGKGHITPPRPVIEYILRSFAEGETTKNIAAGLASKVGVT